MRASRFRPVPVAFAIAVAGLTALAGQGVAEAKAKARAGAGGACPDNEGRPGAALHIWIAPAAPSVGRSLNVLAVSADEGALGSDLAFVDPGGKRTTPGAHRRGGPPFSLEARTTPAAAGRYTVEIVRDGKTVGCRTVEVAGKGKRAASARAPAAGAWAATRAWDRDLEDFYAAYVESLFDAPPAEQLSFRPLAPALRDPERNWMFDYLGLGEDAPKGKTALPAAPDCADLPYFLRAYFSWKLGLPFGFRDCDRGTDKRPPRCGELATNESPLEKAPPDALGAMKKFLRVLANKVHSGSARTALGDDQTDYYPVELTREALRPGTVYADPYGHVLMLVKWVDQGAGPNGAGGILLAVDGQPDQSVGRKRFWEGNFLFASDVAGAGPGFKHFRPLVRGGDGKLAPLDNAALKSDKRFAKYSAEQQSLGREAFYARMGKLINPRGLDAAAAYRETLAALVEQLETRVGSVDNGEKYMRDNKNPVVAMPDGAKIFETVGAWEDYATPSRDMRLLIAMNVLETLPERIVKHPELFNLGGRDPKQVRAEIEKLHATETRARAIEYQRSDGSKFKLTVADLLTRKAGFEMAYNPNDCVEIRWAAPEGSPEASTCQRHAPADQRAKMTEYRGWFHEMKRPAR